MSEGLLVSIVIPVYNRSALLRESVASVLEQDWHPVEIVIVDDGSEDDTLDVAHALAKEYAGLVRVVSRLNGGPGAARQTGLEASRGEFVQFLDSDDLLLPGKLRVQVEALLSDTEAGIAYGRALLEVGGERRFAPERWTGERARTLFPNVLVRRLWDTSNPLYRRSALARIGPWAKISQLEDWEFECRAGKEGLRLVFVDRALTVVRDCAPNRLGRLWSISDDALKERVWVYQQVLAHATASGLDSQCPEFRRFIRTLFLKERIAGGRGLVAEAEALFAHVRNHSRERRGQIAVFSLLRTALGWRVAVRVTEWLRQLPRNE